MSPTTESGAQRFAGAIVLTKREVFKALEACADAERWLLRSGRAAEAAAVAALFELLEDRVSLPGELPRTPERAS